MQGLANGINNSKSLVSNAVKGLSTDISVGMRVNTPSIATNTSKIGSARNIDAILSKMDDLMEALDISIDGKSIMAYSSNNLALNAKRVR